MEPLFLTNRAPTSNRWIPNFLTAECPPIPNRKNTLSLMAGMAYS